MINTIVRAPFIRLCAAFSVGIAVRLILPIPQSFIIPVLLLTFGTAIGLTALNKISGNYRFRWIFGLNLHLFLIALGVCFTGQKLFSFKDGLNNSSHPKEMLGIISEPPECRTKSVRCYLNLDQVKEDNHFRKVTEKILVYFHKDNLSLALRAGDLILLKASPSEAVISGNPFEFDFRRYLSFKKVRYTAYSDSGSWICLAHNKLPFIYQWADRIRLRLLNIFSVSGLSGDELAVASSLVIGDRSGLDDDIRRAYSTAGTMHILAVSGLHVALIYEILIFLLVFLDRTKNGKILKLIIILFVIWAYALITGLPPSVLRACTMFTFILLGELTDRPSNIFNSLACSAFFLLLLDPGNLVNVGFQLSYFAVVSIIIFYPLIYHLFSIKNYMADKIWGITSVTLAAQIGTTPASLYYFHQFPNLFVISNLAIIPLATLIIYFAIVLIVFSGWGWAAFYFGKAFNFLVWVLNSFVLSVEKIPFAVTRGIYISGLHVILLYLLIVTLAYFLISKRSVYLKVTLCILLSMAGLGLFHRIRSLADREVIVYREPGNTIVQFRTGNKSIWLVDNHNDRVDHFVDCSRFAMKCPDNKVLQMDTAILGSAKNGIRFNDVFWMHGNFIQFHSQKFAIMSMKNLSKTTGHFPHLDYILLRGSPEKPDIHELAGLSAKTIVFCNSFPRGYVSLMNSRNMGKQVNNVYCTSISGALKISL